MWYNSNLCYCYFKCAVKLVFTGFDNIRLVPGSQNHQFPDFQTTNPNHHVSTCWNENKITIIMIMIVNYSTLGFALTFECNNVWFRSCCFIHAPTLAAEMCLTKLWGLWGPVQRAHGGFVQIASAEGGDYAGGIHLGMAITPWFDDFDAQEALNNLEHVPYRCDLTPQSASASCTSWMWEINR